MEPVAHFIRDVTGPEPFHHMTQIPENQRLAAAA